MKFQGKIWQNFQSVKSVNCTTTENIHLTLTYDIFKNNYPMNMVYSAFESPSNKLSNEMSIIFIQSFLKV